MQGVIIMNKNEKEKLIKFMLENRKKEIEELEKAIVISTMKIEYLLSNNSYDLHSISALKKRRDSLEEEYEKLKEEISLLESGVLPEEEEENNANKLLYEAKNRLKQCLNVKSSIESKLSIDKNSEKEKE